jgi:SAM-dependent methyltransferase
MPFATDGFDLAVCLDVIEHLEDDRAALRELRRVVAPGGSLLVTVPAYERLWSAHDELNHYQPVQRSYAAAGRGRRGWRSVRTTHFNSCYCPSPPCYAR